MSTNTLKLPAIPFFRAVALSKESANAEEQETAVQAVASEYGHAGVVSLWMLQGYYNPAASPLHGITPATQWWLAPNNSWAVIVKDTLSGIQELESAEEYLKMATCIPDLTMWRLCMEREEECFPPGDIKKHSNLHAIWLRTLAEVFFPQFPQLAQPTCALYRQNVKDATMVDSNTDSNLCYQYPMSAFLDNVHAQHYLACTLPNSAVCQFPPHLLEFRLNKNHAWQMYEQLGLSKEESYKLANTKESASLDKTFLLPEHIFQDSTIAMP